MIKSPFLFSLLQKIWGLSALGLLAFNIFSLGQEMQAQEANRRIAPLTFSGLSFVSLKPLLTDIPAIGYVTDQDLKKTRSAAQFAQAQYILAPTILDPTSTRHPITLINCTSDIRAVYFMKKFQLSPVKRIHQGVFLAKSS